MWNLRRSLCNHNCAHCEQFLSTWLAVGGPQCSHPERPRASSRRPRTLEARARGWSHRTNLVRRNALVFGALVEQLGANRADARTVIILVLVYCGFHLVNGLIIETRGDSKPRQRDRATDFYLAERATGKPDGLAGGGYAELWRSQVESTGYRVSPC